MDDYIKLKTRINNKTVEIILDFWHSSNDLNDRGKHFLSSFWEHYARTNKIENISGTFGNDIVTIEILKEDLFMWKTILSIVATHPKLTKQHKFLFQKPCDKCNDNNRGFSFYKNKRFKNVR
jgi:hypothetical protein